jgi:hypothetical protein
VNVANTLPGSVRALLLMLQTLAVSPSKPVVRSSSIYTNASLVYLKGEPVLLSVFVVGILGGKPGTSKTRFGHKHFSPGCCSFSNLHPSLGRGKRMTNNLCNPTINLLQVEFSSVFYEALLP